MTDQLATVRMHLANIPELVAEAEHYITPGTAPTDPDARHATAVFKIPIVAEVFDLLDTREKDVDEPTDNRVAGERRVGVLKSLGVWVALVYPELEDMGRAPRECCVARSHTVVGEASWLYDYAPDILELHDDFASDIAKLHRELQRACRIRQEYQPRCPQCRWKVEGVYPDGNQLAYWRCTGCDRTWVHGAEIARLAALQPKMTLRQASALLGIAVRTLYNWRAQGRFITDSKGRVDVEHVKRAAQRVAS